jgi:exodeoxyribonuclease V alpha subunit
VVYGWGELDHLVPAYACTIHKSQGSEYPAVVIPLLTQHYAMLQRNLVYTGLTRGKQLVVLVGQKKALAMAIKNHLGRRRYTKLAEWLAPAAIPPDRGAGPGTAAPLKCGATSGDGV